MSSKLTLLWRIPRTAGVSIEAGLRRLGVTLTTLGQPAAEGDYVSCQHALPTHVARGIFSEAEIRGATNLICVRNPWDRAVSLFSLLRTHGRQRPKSARLAPTRRTRWRHAGDERFGEYLDWATSQGPAIDDGSSDIFQGRPSHHWLSIEGRRVPFHTIGRFEQLEDYWQAVCGVFGVEGELPHRNAIEHKPYKEFYTPALRDKVAEFYAAEIEEFGYEFA